MNVTYSKVFKILFFSRRCAMRHCRARRSGIK